jgi:D-3-phosphoglycerate dehydrogenase / 2-oxoglutarate reductase
MPRFRVLVADAISAAGLTPLTEDDRFELVQQTGLDEDALTEAATDVDAILVRSAARITRKVVEGATRLKVIGRAGVGVDTIDVDAATEHGVAVLTAPSGNTTSAAELTMALLLALARRVPSAHLSMQRGEWDRKSFAGSELAGRTLGLVGAGRIGSEVAKLARAFGMRVLVFDPYLVEDRARALDVHLVPLEQLLREANAISVHVPLTDATRGLIGAAELASMRSDAWLLNVARGGVVDEVALLDALERGALGGAGLDVFAEEPLPASHPFRSLGNVVLTPHLGASTAEAQHGVAVEIADAVRLALLEGDLSRAVNAPAIGGEELRRVRPLLDLAERLGRIACALGGEPVHRVDVRYQGAHDDALRLIASSALIGILSTAVGRESINLVSALHLASARGMEVIRAAASAQREYAEYIELLAHGSSGVRRVAGTLLAPVHSRVVRIDDFHVDVAPRGTLLLLWNRDVPGVIGRVGTVLGDAGINIAEYHQARLSAGGGAMAAIRIDGRPATTVLDALRALPEVRDVRMVELD